MLLSSVVKRDWSKLFGLKSHFCTTIWSSPKDSLAGKENLVFSTPGVPFTGAGHFFVHSSLIKLFLTFVLPILPLCHCGEWQGGHYLPARDNPPQPQMVVGPGCAFREHCYMPVLFFWSAIPDTSLTVLFIIRDRIQGSEQLVLSSTAISYPYITKTYSSHHLCSIAWFLLLFHNSFSCAGNCFSIPVGVRAKSWFQDQLRSAFLYIEKHMSSLWMPYKSFKAKFRGVLTNVWEGSF